LPDVGGFALFIRRSVWEECGGFDPNLPHYGNEVELCKRISKQGWRIVWTRNSYIHHLGGQSYSSPAYGKEFTFSSSQQAQEYIDRKHL
jgi:GT2 family glycosyltransferase